MKNICLFIALLFVPQIVCGATVTENILDALGFYETSWDKFLEQSDTNTSTWQCGSLNGEIVRYQVSGDIIGYDERNQIWLHLFTPMSNVLPVTAFSLQMDSHGVVTRQTVIMKSCDESQRKTIEVKTPQKEGSLSSEYTGEEMISEVVDDTPKKIVVSVPVTKEIAQSPVSSQSEDNIHAMHISSTWELMTLYQKQTGGE